jgi:hypothetical protein
MYNVYGLLGDNMRVYQSKQAVVFCWNRRDITLLPGQLVKVPDEQHSLQVAISNNQAFQEVLDKRYIKVSPSLDQIKPPPLPPRMMSRDHLIYEIMSHGVRYDPYALDEQLMYQVHMLRTMAKNKFLTILNANGQPIFVSDLTEVENRLNMEDINRQAQLEEARRTVPVATNDEYKKNNEEQANNTILSIQRDNDIPIDDNVSLRPTMMPSSFDVYDRSAMTMEQYMLLRMQKQEQHRVSIALEKAEKDFARKIEVALPEVQHLIKIDKEVVAKPSIDEVMTTNVVSKGLYDITKVTFENFRYLIEPKNGLFCTSSFTGAELVGMREVNWKSIYLLCYETVFRMHGFSPEMVMSLKADPSMGRANYIRQAQRLYNDSDTDVIAFEINMLQRRYQDIESIEPNMREGTTQALRRGLGTLKKFGIETENFEYKKMERNELKNLCRKVFFMAKWGRQLPKTIAEMDEMLMKWGHDKVVVLAHHTVKEQEETQPELSINNGV